jgi:hypothetical protein
MEELKEVLRKLFLHYATQSTSIFLPRGKFKQMMEDASVFVRAS